MMRARQPAIIEVSILEPIFINWKDELPGVPNSIKMGLAGARGSSSFQANSIFETACRLASLFLVECIELLFGLFHQGVNASHVLAREKNRGKVLPNVAHCKLDRPAPPVPQSGNPKTALGVVAGIEA